MMLFAQNKHDRSRIKFTFSIAHPSRERLTTSRYIKFRTVFAKRRLENEPHSRFIKLGTQRTASFQHIMIKYPSSDFQNRMARSPKGAR